MRICRVENCVAFNQLQPRVRYPYYLSEAKIKSCEKQLENTRFLDVIFDSQGFAIKDKMTEVLHRFQSFSLFPQENAIGVVMKGVKEPVYKFHYQTKDDAKQEWEDFVNINPKDGLENYTSLVLWLEKKLSFRS